MIWVVIYAGFYLLLVIGAFLVYGAIATSIYIPVLKYYGVSEKLVQRSVKMGSIAAGSMIITYTATSSLIGSFGLILSMIITTFFSGKYLRKNLTIKPWNAYFTTLGVFFVSGLVFFGFEAVIFDFL